MAIIRTWCASRSSSRRGLPGRGLPGRGLGGALTALLLAFLAVAPATASELQVFPLRFTLEPKAPTGLLTIANHGNNDTLLQISLFAWAQADNQDKLEPTREVLVNPPVFPLKAGAQQIARFGLRVAPTDVERSYRFTLQEVPQQPAPGFTGLATLLKMSIPIFVPPLHPTVAMSWRIQPTDKGADLVMINGGNVHVQARKLKLTANGTVAFDKAVNIYVLPGATRIIPLELDHPIVAGNQVQLQVDSDQTPFSTAVTAEAGHGPIRR